MRNLKVFCLSSLVANRHPLLHSTFCGVSCWSFWEVPFPAAPEPGEASVGGDRCDGCDSGFALLGALREASRFGANKYDTASTSAANAKLNAGVICGTAIMLSE